MPRSIRIFSMAFGALLYGLFVAASANPHLGNDAIQYFQYAQNLVNTGTYGLVAGVPDAHREPGYGLFLAALLCAAPSAVPATLFLIFAQAFFFALACFSLWGSFLRPAPRCALIFLLLCSPTMISVQALLYSEALAATISVLLLSLWLRAPSRKREAASGALFFAGALNKAYWMRFFVFSPGLVFLRAPTWRNLRWRLAVLFAVGALAAFAWGARNAQLPSTDDTREWLMLLGKERRVQVVDYRAEWGPALAALLGSNFCEQKYSPTVCARHDFRGSDEGGHAFMREQSAVPTLSPSRVFFGEWFSSWPKQLLASALELVRIGFFEYTDLFRGNAGPTRFFPAFWHFAGSLALGWLALFGVCVAYREWPREAFWPPVWLMAFHLLIYLNVTNVARYVVPILPFVYAWAVLGGERFVKWAKSGNRW